GAEAAVVLHLDRDRDVEPGSPVPDALQRAAHQVVAQLIGPRRALAHAAGVDREVMPARLHRDLYAEVDGRTDRDPAVACRVLLDVGEAPGERQAQRGPDPDRCRAQGTSAPSMALSMVSTFSTTRLTLASGVGSVPPRWIQSSATVKPKLVPASILRCRLMSMRISPVAARTSAMLASTSGLSFHRPTSYRGPSPSQTRVTRGPETVARSTGDSPGSPGPSVTTFAD